MADEYKVIQERENPVYTARSYQMQTNLLGYYGGRTYVEQRLSRWAGEAIADFDGSTRSDGSIITGRKEQAHVVPHLRRITNKINEFVFAKTPVRDGLPEDIANDIAVNGKSIDEVMSEVNTLITVHGWCWIGIDAPSLPNNGVITQQQKEQLGIRPYWTVYSALEVVDWYIKDGEIQWLITEGTQYIGDNPLLPPQEAKYRKLWQNGLVTTYFYNGDKITSSEVQNISYNGVPFVLVGNISEYPHSFDDLEGINRTIMDLESVNRQNYFNCVFPQMYLPISVLDTVMQKFNVTAETAVQMIMGYSYPILLAPEDVTPGYIMPDSSAIGTVRDEITSLKKELYDSVGLMLRQETKASISAESKAFDHLDVSAVMHNRANILEDAESKAQNIAYEWDNSYPQWVPIYNTDFDVDDFAEQMQSLILATNANNIPIELQRVVHKEILRVLDKKSTIEDSDKLSIIEAINSYNGLVNNTQVRE